MSFESENKNVEKIVVSNKTYYLVGTSHISENIVKLVAVDFGKDCVF